MEKLFALSGGINRTINFLDAEARSARRSIIYALVDLQIVHATLEADFRSVQPKILMQPDFTKPLSSRYFMLTPLFEIDKYDASTPSQYKGFMVESTMSSYAKLQALICDGPIDNPDIRIVHFDGNSSDSTETMNVPVAESSISIIEQSKGLTEQFVLRAAAADAILEQRAQLRTAEDAQAAPRGSAHALRLV